VHGGEPESLAPALEASAFLSYLALPNICITALRDEVGNIILSGGLRLATDSVEAFLPDDWLSIHPAPEQVGDRANGGAEISRIIPVMRE